jgi:hypothetical protein
MAHNSGNGCQCICDGATPFANRFFAKCCNLNLPISFHHQLCAASGKTMPVAYLNNKLFFANWVANKGLYCVPGCVSSTFKKKSG